VWCELAAVLLLLAARSHRSPIGSAKTKKVRQPSFVAGGVGTLRKTERRGVANISKGAQSVTPNDQTNSSTLLTHLGDENANANQCAISRARHPKVFSGLTQRHLALVTPGRALPSRVVVFTPRVRAPALRQCPERCPWAGTSRFSRREAPFAARAVSLCRNEHHMGLPAHQTPRVVLMLLAR
jgi:hypothetical protein|tara:strand:- start:9337 stop:9885 length:549 start_codon:yes stop_codon:yes gene_type:complete